VQLWEACREKMVASRALGFFRPLDAASTPDDQAQALAMPALRYTSAQAHLRNKRRHYLPAAILLAVA
jgi:hypothetical protein